MKKRKLLGAVLSAAMALSAVVPWTGLTVSAEDVGQTPAGDAGIATLPFIPEEDVPVEGDTPEQQPMGLFERKKFAYDMEACFGVSHGDHKDEDLISDSHNKLQGNIWGEYTGGWLSNPYDYDNWTFYTSRNGDEEFVIPETIEAKIKHGEMKTWTFDHVHDFDPEFGDSDVEFHYVEADAAEKYTINFAAEEGGKIEGNSSITVEDGEKVTFPEAIPEDGWHFDGWYDENGEKLTDVSNVIAEGDATYTAKFEKDDVTPPAEKVVVLDYAAKQADGTVLTLDHEILEVENPDLDKISTEHLRDVIDYMGTTYNYQSTEVNKATNTITYWYTERSYDYTLTYDAGAGWFEGYTGTQADNENVQNVKDAKRIFTVDGEIPVRTGYVFKGWTDDKDSTEVKYLNGMHILMEGNKPLTFYAVWEKEGVVSGDEIVTINYATKQGDTVLTLDYKTLEVENPDLDKISTEHLRGVIDYMGTTYDYQSTEVNKGTNTITYWYTEREKETVTINYVADQDGTVLTLDYKSWAEETPDLDKIAAENFRETVKYMGIVYDYQKTDIDESGNTITYWYTEHKEDPVDPPVDPVDPVDPWIPPYIPTDPDEEITDPETPLVPGIDDEEEITDPETPLAPGIDDAVPGGPSDEVIDDDDVPQVDAPQTGAGTKAAASLALLAGAATVAYVTFKKRNDK